jgi:hypothetical protein
VIGEKMKNLRELALVGLGATVIGLSSGCGVNASKDGPGCFGPESYHLKVYAMNGDVVLERDLIDICDVQTSEPHLLQYQKYHRRHIISGNYILEPKLN